MQVRSLVAVLFLLVSLFFISVPSNAQTHFDEVNRTIRLYLHSVERGLWEIAFANYLHEGLQEQFFPLIDELVSLDREVGPKRFEDINVYWSEVARVGDDLYISEAHVIYKLVTGTPGNEVKKEVSLVYRLVNEGNSGWRIVSMGELPLAIAKAEMLTLAQAEIEAIGMALDAFRQNEGRYPSKEEMQVMGRDNVLVRLGYLTSYGPDPWGKPYQYEPPVAATRTVGMLWSGGEQENDDSRTGQPSRYVWENNLYHMVSPF